MRILFDIGHPAHLHLFRNFIDYFNKRNIEFLITTRDKDITNKLLDHYGYNYLCLTKSRKSFFGMFFELLIRDLKILKLHRKHKFTHAFGTSVSIAHLSFFTKVKSYNFNEDDDSVVPLYTNITFPFTTKIINPDCIKFQQWKNKRVLHRSYHELAYLHPNNFSPDESVLQKYNIEKGKYVIVRFSALTAHHDVNAKGISLDLWKKIQSLLQDYTVIKSIENEKSHKIEPWDMHHVLAYAKMLICDSQTMAVEAAILGVPVIRINTFVGRLSILDELEQKYNLAFGILPNQNDEIISTLKKLLEDNETSTKWLKKKEKMLAEKVDFNKWMIDYFENEIKCAE